MKQVVLSSVLALVAASNAFAQDNAQSLADIRQELTVLWVQIQKLGQELNTSGAATGLVQSGTALDRLSAMENELQRLTAKTEELEFRVERVVRDGTNQIGDLEFRLCELEPDCDIGALGDTPTLGGGDLPVTATPAPELQSSTGPELALGEQAEFDRATTALLDGDFDDAEQLFDAFKLNYPGSPLSAAADLGRGEALEQLGDVREAARSYLASFSFDQQGQTAPNALFHLGAALGKLGQTDEACVMLSEVGRRYPDAAEPAIEAANAMRDLGCP